MLGPSLASLNDVFQSFLGLLGGPIPRGPLLRIEDLIYLVSSSYSNHRAEG
jgi:hypothetical protein